MSSYQLNSVIQLLAYPQVPWFHADDLLRLVLLHCRAQSIGKGFVAMRVQGTVIDAEAALRQGLCKMPHRRQKQSGSYFVRPDVGGFFKRFDHQHHVLHCVKTVKSGRRLIELIAQNEDEVTTRYGLHTKIMLND